MKKNKTYNILFSVQGGSSISPGEYDLLNVETKSIEINLLSFCFKSSEYNKTNMIHIFFMRLNAD